MQRSNYAALTKWNFEGTLSGCIRSSFRNCKPDKQADAEHHKGKHQKGDRVPAVDIQQSTGRERSGGNEAEHQEIVDRLHQVPLFGPWREGLGAPGAEV